MITHGYYLIIMLKSLVYAGENMADLETFVGDKTKDRSNEILSYEEKEKIAEKLLKKHDLIRDPVFGDIWLTLLERKIIDTPTFLRLRGILQLGPTHLVYPGATHNRFLHSLGVLYNADKIVKTCNKNADVFSEIYDENITNKMKISKYEHLLIRLLALLHDLAHVPFSHTLSKEGNIMPDEWQDKKERSPGILLSSGDPAIIDKIIEVCKILIDDEEKAEDFAICLIEDLINYLPPPKGEDDPNHFIYDIVGNTVCADLLDYVVRDMYYSGLTERVGDRFQNYFVILPIKKVEDRIDEYEISSYGTRRLVIVGYRVEIDMESGKGKAKEKQGVISEVVDLLRKRYTLAEKVYFHRTKMKLSSILISAVGSAIRAGIFKKIDLTKINDEKFINELKSKTENYKSKNDVEKYYIDRVKRFIESYEKRIIYKPCYVLKYKKDEDSIESRKFRENIIEKYRNWKERIKLEEEIEGWLGLEPGSISIYCPEEKMNAKIYEVLIHEGPHGPVKKLIDSY